MVKGEDAVLRKQNKARRKKMDKRGETSAVSGRVASMIAAKKRRKSGKRRICQGMCFSLPTVDDPFNDRQGKAEIVVQEKKKAKRKAACDGKVAKVQVGKREGISLSGRETEEYKIDLASARKQLQKLGDAPDGPKPQCEDSGCPSKFLTTCLNEIEYALKGTGTYENQDASPLFTYEWGLEFWKCYFTGDDILETSGSSPSVEQIAWIVSTAADAMARKEKEGFLFSCPYLIFIVSSQEKAAKVRSVCKPLKSLGIHTVSLHSSVSIDHQIRGLKICEPEFIVSTPERLLELVCNKGVDVSEVAFLVIEELESLYTGGHLDTVISIKQALSSMHQTMVFCNSFDMRVTQAVQSLLMSSVNRVSLNDSIASQTACIAQNVIVCSSSEEQLLKCSEVLDDADRDDLRIGNSKVLYVTGKDLKTKLGANIEVKGYSVSRSKQRHLMDISKRCPSENQSESVACMIDAEHIDDIALGNYEVIILAGFRATKKYVEILTRMARYSVKGMLRSFLTEDEAIQCGKPLVEILEECGQEVPNALRNLSVVSSSTGH